MTFYAFKEVKMKTCQDAPPLLFRWTRYCMLRKRCTISTTTWEFAVTTIAREIVIKVSVVNEGMNNKRWLVPLSSLFVLHTSYSNKTFFSPFVFE